MMRALEALFLWSGIFSYLFVFLLFLGGAVFKKARQVSFARKCFIAGFGFHTLTIITRWIESGHLPALGTFEHALAGSWFIAAIFLLMVWRFPALQWVGIAATPFVLLMLGYGIMGEELGIRPFPPPYQSNWLWVHVGFAWIAYGSYHVAAAVAILYLLKQRALRKSGRDIPGFFRLLPEISILDDLTFKLIVYGFITLTIEIGAGAIWAYGLWGRYWAWDPIETWSLVTWLVYGVNIHLRVTYHWKGKRAAWLAIISLIAILITFGGIGFIGGVHTTLL